MGWTLPTPGRHGPSPTNSERLVVALDFGLNARGEEASPSLLFHELINKDQCEAVKFACERLCRAPRMIAARRTNDLLGGLGPDQSSPQSRNLDVAALYFLSATAFGCRAQLLVDGLKTGILAGQRAGEGVYKPAVTPAFQPGPT